MRLEVISHACRVHVTGIHKFQYGSKMYNLHRNLLNICGPMLLDKKRNETERIRNERVKWEVGGSYDSNGEWDDAYGRRFTEI